VNKNARMLSCALLLVAITALCSLTKAAAQFQPREQPAQEYEVYSQPFDDSDDFQPPVYAQQNRGNFARQNARATFNDIDQLISNSMNRFGIPGASFSVGYRGQIIYAKGYGQADVGQGRPFTPDTDFCIASASKAVDATAILRLVDQGKLSLESRLWDVLGRPNLRGDADPAVREITVRQLLHHSAGWKREVPYDQKLMNNLTRGGKIPFEELLLAAMNFPLDYAPGTQAIYSNFQFTVARVVVARASGMSYERYVQEQLAPLGILDMRLEEPKGHYLPGEAKRYSVQGQELPGGRPPYPLTGPMGSWVCSTNDMVKLLMALDGSDGRNFLSPASMQALVAPVPPPVPPRPNGFHFGLGLDRVYQTPNGTGYMKNGGVPGVHAQIEHLPGDLDFALFYNGQGHPDQNKKAIGFTCDEIRRMLPDVVMSGR
jgi:N-acyl-D-amino-acid deacylase